MGSSFVPDISNGMNEDIDNLDGGATTAFGQCFTMTSMSSHRLSQAPSEQHSTWDLEAEYDVEWAALCIGSATRASVDMYDFDWAALQQVDGYQSVKSTHGDHGPHHSCEDAEADLLAEADA